MANDPVFQRAVSRELRNKTRYPVARGWGGATLLPEDEFFGMTYLEGGLALAECKEAALQAVGLWAVGRSLDTEAPRLIDIGGVKLSLTSRQMFLEALQHCAPDSLDISDVYYRIGTTLSANETVRLAGDRAFTNLQLYLEALRLDPSNRNAYDKLSRFFIDELQTTITMEDGTMVTGHRGLNLLVLQWDPSNAEAYNKLGVACVSSDSTVPLPDGRILTKQQLYLESMRCDATYSAAYSNLGFELAEGVSVVLPDGRTATKTQLFLEALHLADHHSFHGPRLKDCLMWNMPAHEAWSRRSHLVYSKANVLFSTLLLGVQRLEVSGVLLLAHQAMLEDMLECWTWGDEAWRE